MSDDKQVEDAQVARRRNRLRGLGFHLLGYFASMTVIVPVNLLTSPDDPWFVLPLVIWGAPLAIHTAFAMGLFDALFARD